jgi:glutamyl-tRNA synthetase
LQILLDWGFKWPAGIRESQREHIARIAAPRIETLAGFGPMIEFLADEPDITRRDLALPKLSEDQAKLVLNAAIQDLARVGEEQWDQSTIGDRLKHATAHAGGDGGFKFKDVARLFYIAVTGSPTSLPLFDGMEILGQQTSIRRLERAVEKLH